MSNLFDEYYAYLSEKKSKFRGPVKVTSNTLSVAGSLVLREDTNIPAIKVAGSLKHLGSIKAEIVKIAGSLEVKNDLEAENVSVTGSLFVGNNLTVNNLFKIAGSANIKGNVKGGRVKIAGKLKATDVECDYFRSSGKVILRKLKADEVFIELHSSTCHINVIEGNDIEVRLQEEDEEDTVTRIISRALSILFECFSLETLEKEGKLYSSKIKGKNIYLENTVCELVEGDFVEIGPGCEIDKVVYKYELIGHPESRVKESVKIS